MPIYSIDGLVPVVHPSAFVHPSAELIGDVWVGEGVYVGPCASLRGDFGRLVLEAGSKLQEHCTVHGFPGADTSDDRGRPRLHGEGARPLHQSVVKETA